MMAMQRCTDDAAACILTALAAAGHDARIEHRADDDNTTVLTVLIGDIPCQVTVEPNTGARSTNVIYRPWRRPEVDPRLGRVFPPLRKPHPAYYKPCLVCNEQLGDGHPVQLIALGPVTHEDRVAHYEGREYPALHGWAHARCTQGEQPASPAE
jgi:hypothetical protein